MSKKSLLIVGLVAVAVAGALAVYLEPTRIVLGTLRRESFYRGRPTSYWRKALQSSDPVVHEQTLAALKEGGADSVPVLTELLAGGESGDWEGAEVRWTAAELLGEIGAPARAGVPALVTALRDPDAHVRTVAAASLGAIGPAAAGEAIPALSERLHGDDRLAAIKALCGFGAEAKPVVPALIELLRDPSEEVRWNAALTLGKIGPGAQAAVPALIAALKDTDANVREHAAESLGQIGAEARAAVPPLTATLKDSSPRVRRDAVRSLGQIGPAARDAVPTVRALLRDPDAKVRTAAEQALRRIAP
jgi:HEAT repeat protein